MSSLLLANPCQQYGKSVKSVSMKDLDDIWYSFGDAMVLAAEKKTGSSETKHWLGQVSECDANFLLLYRFRGSHENSGFVDAAVSWESERARLGQALAHFGFPEEASLIDRALEIGKRLESDYTDELEEKREVFDDTEGPSYLSILKKIIAEPSGYLVDVRDHT